ncbi:MAG: hypothetical protein HYY16_14965 [Planctomycetes bacterium]|nr:hypothetical protein [Planctomycetota bacterium]
MGHTGPNLYELLKQAGAGAKSATPTESPVAAESAPLPEEVDPPAGNTTKTLTSPPLEILPAAPHREEAPSPPPVVPRHAPSLPSRPAPTQPCTDFNKAPGLGERTLRLSYNTAGFMALVTLGIVFLAYAIGVRTGRSAAAAAPPTLPPAPARPVADTRAPAAPPPVYTIRLMEWATRTNQESANAQSNASKLKSELDRRRLSETQIKKVNDRLVLQYGRFSEPSSPQALQALKTLREFRLRRDQEPLFKSASFVRIE